MGLEQCYQEVDITPYGFPYTNTRQTYRSSDWQSVQQADFHKDFKPGPKAVLPNIVRSDLERTHNPHGRHVYTIWKIDSGPVCDVRSHEQRGANDNGQTLPSTEFQCSFPAKTSTRTKLFSKISPRLEEPAHGIVPGTDLMPESEERMLPACSRSNTIKMSTKPFLQYTGKKKKRGQPYKDCGVFYPAPEPVSPERFWHSVSSLTGQDFSRRRPVVARNDSLPVQGFNGGPTVLPSKAGVRCGYALSYATLNRE